MSPPIERYGLLLAAVAQIFAVGWWTATLNTTVNEQKAIVEELNKHVGRMDDRLIRLETLYENNVQ